MPGIAGFSNAMATALAGGEYNTYGYSCAGAIGYGAQGSWTNAFNQVIAYCTHLFGTFGCNIYKARFYTSFSMRYLCSLLTTVDNNVRHQVLHARCMLVNQTRYDVTP